jgi:hypothetical protein
MENTLTMLQARGGISPELGQAVGIVIGKVLLCAPAHIERMGIDQGLFDWLHEVLLGMIKLDSQIRARIQALYSRSRIKLAMLRKLMRLP